MSEESTKERNPYDTRTLTNPLDEDFQFFADKVRYDVPARSTKHFPAFIAEHGAKHLADRIVISRGRLDDRVVNDKVISMAISMNDMEALMNGLLDQDLRFASTISNQIAGGDIAKQEDKEEKQTKKSAKKDDEGSES